MSKRSILSVMISFLFFGCSSEEDEPGEMPKKNLHLNSVKKSLSLLIDEDVIIDDEIFIFSREGHRISLFFRDDLLSEITVEEGPVASVFTEENLRSFEQFDLGEITTDQFLLDSGYDELSGSSRKRALIELLSQLYITDLDKWLKPTDRFYAEIRVLYPRISRRLIAKDPIASRIKMTAFFNLVFRD
jgi:hypothetical protein